VLELATGVGAELLQAIERIATKKIGKVRINFMYNLG